MVELLDPTKRTQDIDVGASERALCAKDKLFEVQELANFVDVLFEAMRFFDKELSSRMRMVGCL